MDSSPEWVWQVIDRVGARGQGSDAAVLGNLLERIKAQTTRLGSKRQPGTADNAIIRVPSPRALGHPPPLEPKPLSKPGSSSPPVRSAGALGTAATAPEHALDPDGRSCAADVHGSAAGNDFAQRPTLAASAAVSASAPMVAPSAGVAQARRTGANVPTGRHRKVPPVGVTTSARPSSVRPGLCPQPTSAQQPRLNIELSPPPSLLPSPGASGPSRRASFTHTGTVPHVAAAPRASFIADSRIHAPLANAQVPDARLLHSTSSISTSMASCASHNAQSHSLAHHPGRLGRSVRDRSQLSIKVPQGSVAASHYSQQSSPATPQDEIKRPPQERVVNQEDWLAWCSGGPLPPGVLDANKDGTSSSSRGPGRRLSFMESRKEALRLDRMATRARSSVRVRHSLQGHMTDGPRDAPQQQSIQLCRPATPDSFLPSEWSAASVAQDLPASLQSPTGNSHLQVEQQQRPRSAARCLSNLGIQAAFNSFSSSPDPKLPVTDEESPLPQSNSTSLQDSSWMTDLDKASHRKVPELMEQGVPLTCLHSACADGQYRDAHAQGHQVVHGICHDLLRALEDSDGEDTSFTGQVDSQRGGDTPGSRYAAMQRRMTELHHRKMKGVQEGSEGVPSGTSTAAPAGAFNTVPGAASGIAPGSADSAPPLVSWAAAWRASLQAHYSAAMEKAKQRLERQALVSKANLGLNSSFTVPNTPLGQGWQPSNTRPTSPLGARNLRQGRGNSIVSFAVKDNAHDTADDNSLASPSNSSVASLGWGQGVDSNLHHHHHHHEQQQQQQQGRQRHLGSSKSSVGGSSLGGMGQKHSSHSAPAVAVPNALLQQSEEAATINAALQLLDAYSQLSLEVYGQEGGAAAITKIRSAIELEAMDLPDPLHLEGSSVFASHRKQLRRPIPPPEFPSGAAWSYLAAAQAKRHDGLATIEGSVRDIHTKMKVMVEQRGQAHGLTATPALLAIEQSLDVQALSTVRALRHQTQAGLHSLSSWTPVYQSRHPPLATPPESATIAQAALQRLHQVNQSNEPHSSYTGVPEVPYHEDPSQGLFGIQPATPHARQNQVQGEMYPPPEASLLSRSCLPPRAPHEVQQSTQEFSPGNGAWPPSHAPRGVCSPTGVYTVSSTAPLVPDPDKQGPILEGLWWWLEDLMVEMHGCESMRFRELEVEKASASTSQVVRRDLHSPRPSTRRRSRPSSPVRGLESMLQFDATKPTWQAKAHASKMAELAAAANAMRAAGSKFTDPECLPRILYFMMHLTASIEQGRVPWKDAGFLLCASLELLLGEMEWLASHVHLAQGPNSPHLRVLHAALSAYECQADYSARLGQHAADVRTQLEKAQERARVAEEALEEAEGRAQADHSLAASLHMQCQELQGENKQLNARIAALEERLALQDESCSKADADCPPG